MDESASPVPATVAPTQEVVIDAAVVPQQSTDQTSAIASLLHKLDEVASASGQSQTPRRPSSHENKLVQVRLGIASGLYTALRCKHVPTASHSLRVALGCSSWAAAIGLDDQARDELEVAALLHDVGKIGVPDSVLLKPGRLHAEEEELMNRHREMTVEVLASCGASHTIIDIVNGSMQWFSDGNSEVPQGEQIPLASRMLSIVDAFDSMTTDHVYRPARSRERALAELFRCAGSQFDPKLVQQFSEQLARDQNMLSEKLARRWLQQLPASADPIPWTPSEPSTTVRSTKQVPNLFEKKLIDNMHDGVVFVDGQSQILLWNTGAERLTGVSGNAARGRTFLPSLLDMYNAQKHKVVNSECPVALAVVTGVQSLVRVDIMGRHGQYLAVDLHAIPVRGSDGVVHGATVLLHDVSSEASLEEKCQALHDQVAKDPMTQVANRAEFDRMLESFIAAHQESDLPCSLIMCDIDHFKSINDTYGHQAGDEAIITLASLLKSMCRSGDLVARYGGEEFAILCADCSNASAAGKAENIRKQLSEYQHSCLGNKAITASFGVTELQQGDIPETMLRRADRALLLAKDQGRNQVVQLGDGMMEEQQKKSWWPFRSWSSHALVEASLVTAVPMEVAVEKLRGFIADQNAKITKTTEDELFLEVTDRNTGSNRRRGDRTLTFLIELKFSQRHIERSNSQGMAAGSYVETRVDVAILPRRDRDRRRDATIDKARRLLGSLKSYLMAKEDDGQTADDSPQEPAAASSDA